MNKYRIFILCMLFANTHQKCLFIYQLFLASFKDSDGDGIGDVKGITSKIDHFVDIGVDCVSITPFFRSGNMDAGYDIIDYLEIDPQYGSMEDVEELIAKLNRKGIKLIIDLVINHSSKEHIWFQQSINKIHPYTDYYVWSNPKGYDQRGNPIPPNNWQNIFSGSAWTWNSRRKQFYLHQFVFNQPDLNLTNIWVQKEIEKIIQFWVDKGVGGIRLDAARHFVEDAELRDEPLWDKTKTNIGYEDLDHIYTSNRPETYDVIRKIENFTISYTNTKKMDDVIFLAEVHIATETELMNYFLQYTFPYNFDFIKLNNWPKAIYFYEIIQRWIEKIPGEAVPNWMTENQDAFRISDKFCHEYSQILIMIIMSLPGIVSIYYGQEIGMTSFNGPNIHYDIRERLPMQWDDSENAGFSTKQLFIPVNMDYWKVNLESQKKNPYSHYSMFKKLSILRHTTTIKYGSLEVYTISDWIMIIVRKGSLITYITVINVGTNTEIVNLHTSIKITSKLMVEVGTLNSGFKTGYKINPRVAFKIRPASGLVLSMKKQEPAKKSPKKESFQRSSPKFVSHYSKQKRNE